MPGNMFYTRSVCLLDSQSSLVFRRWEEGLYANNPGVVSHEELVEAFRDRVALSRLLKASRDDLKKINPAIFPYLHPYQKESLRRKLIRAHYLYSVQCRIDEIEMRGDGLAKNLAQCKHYEMLLHSLQNKPAVGEKIKPEAQLKERSDQSEKPLAWFGMVVLAPLFSTHLFDLCSGKISFIKNNLVEIDRKGLYMGWSRTLLLSVIAILPQSVTAEHNPGALLNQAGFGLSYIGFFVVQMSFTIEILTLAKNSFAGAWMSRHDDLKIPVWEQFTIQLDQRKYVLLNWLILSAMNVVGFLWLTGLVQAAPFGPLMSAGYRVAQLCLLACRYDQELTQHLAMIEQIRSEVAVLQEKQFALRCRLEKATCVGIEKEGLEMEFNVLQEAIDSQVHLRSQRITKWRFKTSEFQQQMMFTLGLLSGVALLSCLVFPPAAILPATVLVLGLTGAAICFTSIMLFSAARGHLDAEKNNEAQNVINEQLTIYLETFSQLKQRGHDPDTQMEMKQIYLQMKELVTHSEYQARLLQHQQTMLVMKVLRDALLPVFVLAMFIFLPTGIGLGVVVGVALLFLLLNKVMSTYEPIAPEPCSFDEKAYAEFAADPHQEKLFDQEKSHTFRERLIAAKMSDENRSEPKKDDGKDEIIGGDFEGGM